MLTHPNVLRSSIEQIYTGNTWESVLVIETGLQLNPDGPDYDGNAEADLHAAIVDFMQQHPATIDRAALRSTRLD